MQQIQLADQLYKEAERRAAEAGFPSVDDSVAEVISQSIHESAESYDHVFTPKRIANLDRISAGLKPAGRPTAPRKCASILKRNANNGWILM